MLAVAAQAPFDSEDWLFEIKWDGVRALAFVEDGQVRIQSRHLLDMTPQFPELTVLGALTGGTVLDGELVCLKNGKPSLARIQQRVHLQARHRIRLLSERAPVNFVVFDLLYLHGRSVMSQPLVERRAMLEELVAKEGLPRVQISQAIAGCGRNLFQAVAAAGLEGIMAKRAAGAYQPGKRSREWNKIKALLISLVSS